MVSMAEQFSISQLVGGSVRGASHIRNNLPNQDAIKWKTIDEEHDVHVMSLADGHGSQVCFRSDIGAKLAVDTMNEVIAHTYKYIGRSNLNSNSFDDIAYKFIHLWGKRALKHLKDHPFRDEEVEGLDKYKRRTLGRNALTAYGSTLLSVLVQGNRLQFWQIGDGDILTVDEQGEVIKVIEEDNGLIGNETKSICDTRALKEFRHCLLDKEASKIGLIMMSTDGYANSFQTKTGFLKAGKDYYNMVKDYGVGEIGNSLDGWLNETSELGSGDDITLGLIYIRNESK